VKIQNSIYSTRSTSNKTRDVPIVIMLIEIQK